MRRITVSKTRPPDWPEVQYDDKGRPLPMKEQRWEDEWGKHVLKEGSLTTDYVGPQPVRMPLKRKYGRA